MSHPTNTDAAVRFSRLSLWCALAVIAVLGAVAIATVAAPDSAPQMRKLMQFMPVAIVVLLAVLYRSGRAAQGGMAVVEQDELHRQSIALGYRNGFFAMLAAQPVIALLAVPPHAGAALSLVAGAGAMLLTVLWKDR